jgi:NAD(P)-dependent dehydrogenase (short-subunit alcohol dehydrogenase family)
MAGPRLAGKVAIITGSASGIGRASARLFAREGAKVVVVTDKRVALGQETVQMIEAAGGAATFVQADVGVGADIQRMVQYAVDTYGRLDVLVNNAATARPGPVVDLSEEDWDRTQDVCLKQVFLGSKYAIPEMLKTGGGSIVNISSVNGIITNPHFAAYSAAKAGMLGLTRSIALDYGLQGIRCNVICPGYIANERGAQRLEEDPQEKWAMTQMQPVGRFGVPEDVAYMALYLASDESGYVTGATFVIDGGLTIQSPEALVRPSFRRRWRKGILVQQDE